LFNIPPDIWHLRKGRKRVLSAGGPRQMSKKKAKIGFIETAQKTNDPRSLGDGAK